MIKVLERNFEKRVNEKELAKQFVYKLLISKFLK
jgi:hypothetical protein